MADNEISHNSKISPSTLAIHADDFLNGPNRPDVAPPIHVSTTFRYTSNIDELVPVSDEALDITNPQHVYSRVSTSNTTRFEALLTSLLGAPALSYSSGLAAFHALLVHLRPRIIAISDGYHGCHGVIRLLSRLYGLQSVRLEDAAAWDAAGLGAGDVVHVETPLNPSGEAVDLKAYAEKARARGALLTVDATFAPPPLQDPFALGAHVVMHSGTKYFGGHSDMLCGVLATRDRDVWRGLWADRIYLGSVMGGLEGWLGVRSLRTLEVRIRGQSGNAVRLVEWLAGCLEGRGDAKEVEVVQKGVERVVHASLQAKEHSWVSEQMPGGYGPVFAMWMKNKELARRLPGKLQWFHHATSLGGVESLVEWRRMSDAGCDERLVRVSVGLESWEDLRDDLLRGIGLALEEVK